MQRPYDTLLQIRGEAALSKATLEYLFEQFPQTAELVNLYSDSDYKVVYTRPDRTQFYATNNRSMQATVDIIDRPGPGDDNNYLLFENGHAKIMFWRFSGKSVVELALTEKGDQSAYKINIYLFSSSRVFHAFFESALFSYLMRSMFKKIVGDVVDATRQFTKAKATAPLDPVFAAGLRQHLGIEE